MDIEEQIRKAIEAGQFDNLPGAGKPLRFEDNPYEDPAWSLAYRVLRNGGFSLPWIETRREIEGNLQSARVALRLAWEARQSGVGGLNAGVLEQEWERSKAIFVVRLEEINRQIQRFNLEAPSTRFQLALLKAEREIELTMSRPSDTLANT